MKTITVFNRLALHNVPMNRKCIDVFGKSNILHILDVLYLHNKCKLLYHKSWKFCE